VVVRQILEEASVAEIQVAARILVDGNLVGLRIQLAMEVDVVAGQMELRVEGYSVSAVAVEQHYILHRVCPQIQVAAKAVHPSPFLDPSVQIRRA
jgi:hypothetical protein